MTRTDSNVWVWETDDFARGEEIEFKIFVNDHRFEYGDNHKAQGGKTIILHPNL